jgi:hypothetical protein
MRLGCKALKNTLKKAKVSNAPQNDWQALINLVGKIRDEVQDAYHLRGLSLFSMYSSMPCIFVQIPRDDR